MINDSSSTIGRNASVEKWLGGYICTKGLETRLDLTCTVPGFRW